MDEPKLNKIQKKHLRDTPAGRYYEDKEKPGTGERYNPIQQKYLKEAGWTFDKTGAVKTAPAPERIQARQPAAPEALYKKSAQQKNNARHSEPVIEGTGVGIRSLYAKKTDGRDRTAALPRHDRLPSGAGDMPRKQAVGIKIPDSKPASVLLPAAVGARNGTGETSILRELWGDNEDDYPEMIARFLKKPSGNRLAGDSPQDQRTETVERLFPAEDRSRLPERRSEGLGRMEAGKLFPEQEEKPERAPGRERIRPMRASGRLQHEDMPPEQFSGVVPYDGGETPETPEVPQTSPEAGQTENNSSGSDIRYFDNNGQQVWADMSTLQGIGVLPDGTYINTTGDAYADTLYEIIRAEAAGEISTEEATREKTELARQIAVNEYPEEEDEQEELFQDRLDAFLNRELSYYEIPDVTERLNEIMLMGEAEMNAYVSRIDMMADVEKSAVVYFREMVTDHGPYDIKYWPEFLAHSLFLFDGEVVSRDALGNILYGYLGKSQHYSNLTLRSLAGANQMTKSNPIEIIKNIFSFGDDKRDQKRILQGIKIYNETH